jgi:ribosomal protein S18 acetylase RimI-like enzyme
MWRAEFLAATFEGRRDGLLRKAVNGLIVLLATAAGRDVGYCVCTIDEDRQGEIDSIYVVKEHRGRGVGRALMREAMRWLGSRPTRAIIVDVLSGNEDAMRLYKEIGFHARTVRLRHVPEGDAAPTAATDHRPASRLAEG